MDHKSCGILRLISFGLPWRGYNYEMAPQAARKAQLPDKIH